VAERIPRAVAIKGTYTEISTVVILNHDINLDVKTRKVRIFSVMPSQSLTYLLIIIVR